MTATHLVFPVLCLGPDVGRYAVEGREILDWRINEEDVSTCMSWDLKHGARQGMLLADNAGRFWRIVRVENLGVVGGFWMRVLRFLLQQSVHRISQEIVEDTPLSFANLKERVCACIAGNPDAFRDDEAIAGEDGPPRDDLEMLDELMAAVRKSETLPQVINAIFAADLPG